MAFLFADLIILPILVIYRRYCGTKMMLFILGTFYLAMVVAGYIVELVFGGLGLERAVRHAEVAEASIPWKYTTVLNIVSLIVAGALLVRFVTTGGVAMLRVMGGSPTEDRFDAHGRHRA